MRNIKDAEFTRNRQRVMEIKAIHAHYSALIKKKEDEDAEEDEEAS